MKKVITLIVLATLTQTAFSQLPLQIACKVGEPRPVEQHADSSKIKIRLRCISTVSQVSPLFVLDGIVIDVKTFQGIDPDDIESVDILKDDLPIIGCRRPVPIILITTKSSRLRQFIVKDLLDGSKIAGATVSFVNGKDTLMYVAGDDGAVSTSALKSGKEYSMTVSSMGYKSQSYLYKNWPTRTQEILLERDAKICDDVILTSRYYLITRRIVCCGGGSFCCRSAGIWITRDSIEPDKKNVPASITTIYPNPVLRGQAITIQTLSDKEHSLKVNITDMSGKLVLTQSYKNFKGTNRMVLNTDSRWTAGIYVIQLVDDRGELVKREKLLVQ